MQKYLSDVLMNAWASLLSVLDSNLNVNLLGSAEEELQNLWVKLFECDTILSQVHTKNPKSSIDVRPPTEVGFVQFQGSFPFSFMIFGIILCSFSLFLFFCDYINILSSLLKREFWK